MAATGSEINSVSYSKHSLKPKPKTAVNERCAFEDLAEIAPDTLTFSVGALPFAMMSKLRPILVEATKQRMDAEEYGYMFQYGALRGDQVFVQALAKFLSERYQDAVNSDDIVCTCGATSGLMMLTCTMFKSGDYVFVEDPTYFNALKIFHNDLGLNVIPVPTDKEGVNIDALEKVILEHQQKLGETNEKRPYRAMFYTIPVFNNPLTISLPPDRCTALIKVLRKHNIVAVCDDVYNMINFDSKPPPKRLFSYDDKSDSDYQGNVVSNGTFSKIIAPGMRLGWFEAPETVIAKVIFSSIFSSGGGMNQYTSAIIGTALQNGILSSYITDTINTLKRKMELLCNALDKYAKPYVKYQKPKGGYFVWVELPSNCDGQAFQTYCLKNYKVCVRCGSCFSPNQSFKNFIRLSFSFVEEERIEEGIQDMATALQNFLKQ